MSRVLIVNMPFSNLGWPNLGPSLLKAALTRRGIGSDLAYFNFDFAERIGIDDSVKYLSHDAVREIDDFFGPESASLSVKLFSERSECLNS